MKENGYVLFVSSSTRLWLCGSQRVDEKEWFRYPHGHGAVIAEQESDPD